MILTIVAAILILSILMTAHEFGHFIATKGSGVKVEEFGFGFPPRVLRIARIGETDITLNAIPFGAFVRPAGENDPNVPGGLQNRSKRVRFLVAVAGPAVNLILAVVIFAAAFMAGWPSVSSYKHVLIIGVEKGSPAATSGLRVGDVVTAADGTELLTPDDLIAYTASHRGEPVSLTVLRSGQTSEVQITPRVSPPAGKGAMGIGISSAPEKTVIVRYGLLGALGKGFSQAWQTLKATVQLPGEVIRGNISPDLARPVGPVGIVEMTGNAAQQGAQTGWWQPLLNMVAAISLALGFTNLLPLPALDGGRIVFILIEAIRGRPIDAAKENLVHWVGLMALVVLLIFITYQDLVTPIPNFQLPSPF
jgi:regulator of sigma E protease